MPGFVDQHVEAIDQIERQPRELVLRQRDLHAHLFRIVLRLVDEVRAERRILEGRDRRRLGAVRRFEILAECLCAQAVAEEGVVGVGQRDVRDFVARAFADDVSLDRAARDSGGDIARHGDPIVVALDVVAIERQLDTLIFPVVAGLDERVQRARVHRVALRVVGADHVAVRVVRDARIAQAQAREHVGVAEAVRDAVGDAVVAALTDVFGLKCAVGAEALLKACPTASS